MAKKTPKDPNKLSNGRIEEARVNHVIQHADGTKLQVDFGHVNCGDCALRPTLESVPRSF